jgi:hypothetical protein
VFRVLVQRRSTVVNSLISECWTAVNNCWDICTLYLHFSPKLNISLLKLVYFLYCNANEYVVLNLSHTVVTLVITLIFRCRLKSKMHSNITIYYLDCKDKTWIWHAFIHPSLVVLAATFSTWITWLYSHSISLHPPIWEPLLAFPIFLLLQLCTCMYVLRLSRVELSFGVSLVLASPTQYHICSYCLVHKLFLP